MAPKRKNRTTSEPAYRVPNLYKFSLQQLLDLSLQQIKPEKTWGEQQLIILNTYWMSPYFTFTQAFPLIRIYREPYHGFYQAISLLCHGILLAKQIPHEFALAHFKLMNVPFYLLKKGKDYMLLSQQLPTAWSPWFPFQITWVMQHLWYILYPPKDLQLIWWWFGQPHTFVRPPTWTHTTDLDSYRVEQISKWKNHYKTFPYLLECFINLSSQQQEEAHQFLQDILNLYLKSTDTGPGYTVTSQEATYPIYSDIFPTKEGKGTRLYLQGYVGETQEPLQTPEQIWKEFKKLRPQI